MNIYKIYFGHLINAINSFKNDFKILLKTIYKVIASKDISNDPFVTQPALNELRSKTTAKA